MKKFIVLIMMSLLFVVGVDASPPNHFYTGNEIGVDYHEALATACQDGQIAVMVTDVDVRTVINQQGILWTEELIQPVIFVSKSLIMTFHRDVSFSVQIRKRYCLNRQGLHYTQIGYGIWN